MKVLDLRCVHGHAFEGWFSSEDDYQTQSAQGILCCPVCESLQVSKVLSAPYVSAKSNRRPAVSSNVTQTTSNQGRATDTELQSSRVNALTQGDLEQDALRQAQEAFNAHWIAHARTVIAQGEDVGNGFAQEAKRIHEGQAPERLIHGQASLEEVVELLEDGVPVLPLPHEAKEPVQ
ncbi:DUF1178 family protein [Lampropedia puyangensis]|uniref:DUF1178 family protein n=1 Tax=Lampropedia puyangensis TaxID=1330072 RepID=A0A4S8FFI4_9BURK|nr:DUF1178 family protein [Lampropedia puyangensis]THU05324.1 DUF1178 family protein [Lampropedia puyangensis]